MSMHGYPEISDQDTKQDVYDKAFAAGVRSCATKIKELEDELESVYEDQAGEDI